MTKVSAVWSPEALLADERVRDLLAHVPEGAEVVRLEAEPGGVAGLDDALFAESLFGPERAVVVRHAERLNAAAAKRLAEALGRDIVPVVAVVQAVSEREPATLAKALASVAKLERLPAPRGARLVAWVTQRMKSYGLSDGGGAAQAFVDAVGTRLGDLDHALEQIATRAGRRARLGPEHVAAHFRGQADLPVWTLYDAVIARDTHKALSVLHALLARGEDPMPLLGAIVAQTRYLMRAKGLLERNPGLDDATLARELGVTPGRSGVLRRQAPRATWEWLVALHDAAADADFELKGGEEGAVLPPEMVLERLVVSAAAPAAAKV